MFSIPSLGASLPQVSEEFFDWLINWGNFKFSEKRRLPSCVAITSRKTWKLYNCFRKMMFVCEILTSGPNPHVDLKKKCSVKRTNNRFKPPKNLDTLWTFSITFKIYLNLHVTLKFTAIFQTKDISLILIIECLSVVSLCCWRKNFENQHQKILRGFWCFVLFIRTGENFLYFLLAKVLSMASTTSAKIGSTSLSAFNLFNLVGYWTRIFSVFSLNVAILVFKVSSLSSARFSAEAAARFKILSTKVSLEHSK